MDGSLAVQKFSIQPEVQGNFEWVDSKTLRFIPREPFQTDTSYTVSLSAGPLTKNGEALKKSRTWHFQVRPPLIVYVGVDQEKSRLLGIERRAEKQPHSQTIYSNYMISMHLVMVNLWFFPPSMNNKALI